MIRKACVTAVLVASLSSSAWAGSFNLGLVDPIQAMTTSYSTGGGLYDEFSFSIASGTSVKIDFQGVPDANTFLPPIDFRLVQVDLSATLANWSGYSFFDNPDFSTTNFRSYTASGLTVGTGYMVAVYGGGSLPPDSHGTYSLTLSIDQTAPVPEPETYAMMLAGLGLLGFVARRRKQKLAA
jgi:hypothetical protein